MEDKRDALAVGSGVSAIVLLYGIVGLRRSTAIGRCAGAARRSGRGRLLTARMLAYGLAGLVLGALMILIALAIGVPLLGGSRGRTSARATTPRSSAAGWSPVR